MYIYKKDTVPEIRMVHMLHMLCKHELRCHFLATLVALHFTRVTKTLGVEFRTSVASRLASLLMSLLTEEKKWCAYNCDKMFNVIFVVGYFHKITGFS